MLTERGHSDSRPKFPRAQLSGWTVWLKTRNQTNSGPLFLTQQGEVLRRSLASLRDSSLPLRKDSAVPCF